MSAGAPRSFAGDADSAEFWRAADRRRLVGQRCGGCGVWRWPPREHCSACGADRPVWDELPGTGTIVGAVVVHRALDPSQAERVPFAVVHVELDGTDGAMVLTSNLLPGQWPQARVGARVDVRFTRPAGGRMLPLFTLDYHARRPAPTVPARETPAPKKPRRKKR